MKTPEQKLSEITAWHSKWERTWAHTVVVDEQCAHDGQYAETITDMSCSAEAEAEYWREVNRILGSKDADSTTR